LAWVAAAYAQQPHKPLVVEEGMYEPNPDLPEVENGRRMVRRQGYWSFLAGARGYTSGTHGVWGWGKVGLAWADPVIRCPPLSEAMEYVSSARWPAIVDVVSQRIVAGLQHDPIRPQSA
jgi:hypothetical protein